MNDWLEWRRTKGEEILTRHKEIISPEDKELVNKHLFLTQDLDEYIKTHDEMGMNWHSGGSIMEAHIPYKKFSEESKKLIYTKLKDEIEYQKESNTHDRFIKYTISEHEAIQDHDVVKIVLDDEWGISVGVIGVWIKADEDPVLDTLWSIDRKQLPVKNS